jgi:hypothetical protein
MSTPSRSVALPSRAKSGPEQRTAPASKKSSTRKSQTRRRTPSPEVSGSSTSGSDSDVSSATPVRPGKASRAPVKRTSAQVPRRSPSPVSNRKSRPAKSAAAATNTRKKKREKKEKPSLAFDALPEAVKPLYFINFLPTIISLLSMADDIWLLNDEEYEKGIDLLRASRMVMEAVYPNQTFPIESGNQLHMRVRVVHNVYSFDQNTFRSFKTS